MGVTRASAALARIRISAQTFPYKPAIPAKSEIQKAAGARGFARENDMSTHPNTECP